MGVEVENKKLSDSGTKHSSGEAAESPLAALSGRELDAAVAERVMGWLPPDHPDTFAIRAREKMTHSAYDSHYVSYLGVIRQPPRYSTDIAAAMDVESRIVELNLTRAYCDELYNIVAIDKSSEQLGAFRFDLIHATAEQRCRAALAALNATATKG